jgi:hypothetical protein
MWLLTSLHCTVTCRLATTNRACSIKPQPLHKTMQTYLRLPAPPAPAAPAATQQRRKHAMMFNCSATPENHLSADSTFTLQGLSCGVPQAVNIPLLSSMPCI